MSSNNTKFLKDLKIKEIYENSEQEKNKFYTHVDIIECDTSISNIKKVKLQLMDNLTIISKTKIEREYNSKKELFSNPNGEKDKVACHISFELVDEYLGNEIAKDIHEKELEIYSSENIKEIHLYAWNDGIVVWLKLGYKYMNKDSIQLIAESLMLYLETVKKLSEEELDNIYNALHDGKPLTEDKIKSIDTQYYKKSDSIVGFTKWYEDNYRVEGINWEEFDYCYPALGMYKEVE